VRRVAGMRTFPMPCGMPPRRHGPKPRARLGLFMAESQEMPSSPWRSPPMTSVPDGAALVMTAGKRRSRLATEAHKWQTPPSDKKVTNDKPTGNLGC